MPIPTIDDIADADIRIRPLAVETPLLEWAELNKETGGRILVKAELLQRTGTFKFRGAIQPHLSRYQGRISGRRCRLLVRKSRSRGGGSRAPLRP